MSITKEIFEPDLVCVSSFYTVLMHTTASSKIQYGSGHCLEWFKLSGRSLLLLFADADLAKQAVTTSDSTPHHR